MQNQSLCQRVTGVLTPDNKITYAIIMMALLLLFIMLRAPMLTLTSDEAAWQTSVEKLLHGAVLMREATMAKGPYLVAHHFAFTSILGRNAIALNLMGSLWALLTGILIVWLGGKLAGRRCALAVAFFWVVAMSHEGSLKGAQAEVLMILYTTAGMCALIAGLTAKRAWLVVLSGMTLMVASLIKQVVIFDMMAAFLAIIVLGKLTRTDIRTILKQLAWMSVGAFIAFLPVAAYIVQHSLYNEFVASYFGSAVGYAGRSGFGLFLRNFLAAIPKTLSPMSGLYIAAIAGMGMLISKVGRTKQREEITLWDHMMTTAAVVLPLWAIFALIGIAAPRRFGIQYFVQLAPVAALMAGWFVSRCFPGERKHHSVTAAHAAWAVIFFQLILLLPPLVVGVGGWRRAPITWRTPSNERQVGTYLRSVTNDDDKIYVWGDRYAILYWAQRQMAASSPWGTFGALGLSHAGLAAGTARMRTEIDWDWLRNTLATYQPEYVVISPLIASAELAIADQFGFKQLPELQKIIEQNYTYDTTICDYQLYQQKPTPTK